MYRRCDPSQKTRLLIDAGGGWGRLHSTRTKYWVYSFQLKDLVAEEMKIHDKRTISKIICLRYIDHNIWACSAENRGTILVFETIMSNHREVKLDFDHFIRDVSNKDESHVFMATSQGLFVVEKLGK